MKTPGGPLFDVVPPGKIAEFHRCVGACLVKYQQIEGLLKILLPHMHQPSCEPPLHVDWRRLIDSKATLGILFREFATKYGTDMPDVLGGYLEQLAAQRNDVVHHRFVDPARPLKTNAQVDEAIAELRDRIGFAEPFAAALRGLAIACQDGLDSDGAITQINCTLELRFVEQG